MVSPCRMSTAPSACLASLPVSIDRVRDPSRSSRVCCMLFTFSKSQAAGRQELSLSILPATGFKLPVIGLLADAETLDQLGVSLRVLALEIVQQPAALTD